MDSLDKLREMLTHYPPGPINEKILDALREAWNLIEGSSTAKNKQTLTGRRKRFRTQFHKQLEELGWEQTGRYIYRKKMG